MSGLALKIYEEEKETVQIAAFCYRIMVNQTEARVDMTAHFALAAGTRYQQTALDAPVVFFVCTHRKGFSTSLFNIIVAN